MQLHPRGSKCVTIGSEVARGKQEEAGWVRPENTRQGLGAGVYSVII